MLHYRTEIPGRIMGWTGRNRSMDPKKGPGVVQDNRDPQEVHIRYPQTVYTGLAILLQA